MTIDEARELIAKGCANRDEFGGILIDCHSVCLLPEAVEALRLLLADHARLRQDRDALAKAAVSGNLCPPEEGAPCWCAGRCRRKKPDEHDAICTEARAAYGRYLEDPR